MDDHAEMISGMYRELLESDPGAPPMMAGAGRGERG
jgi:hypothetical protein